MFAFSLNSSEGSQSGVPSAASVIRTSLSSLFAIVFRSPRGRRATIHRQGSAAHERRLRGAEKRGHLGHLLGLDEAFYRRSRKHYLLYNFVLRYPSGPGLIGDLPLHERRPDVGWADGVRRHT